MIEPDREQRAWDVIREAIDEIGMAFGLPIAKRAELIAERLVDLGDADTIFLMVKRGVSGELSKSFSEAKATARSAHRAASKGSTAEDRANQLAFPVIVPGLPPVPLVNATHTLIAEALKSERAQLKGRMENIASLERFLRVSQRWPDTTIGELLRRGLISRSDLEVAA